MASQTTTVKRDYLIDNLKLVMISLVVIGHYIEHYMEPVPLFKAFFVGIYTFHIPAFAFISGYLSKSEKSLSAGKLTTSLLVPYIVFSVLWDIRESIHIKTIYLDLFSAPFHLWYLVSLFTWRLFLPIFRTFKHYVILSFVLSLLVGLSPLIGTTLSLARTISLFPFFILGTLCSSSALYAVHKKKYLFIPGIFILIVIGFYVTYYPLNWSIVFWSDPYHLIGYSYTQGLIYRLCLMMIAAVATTAVIVLTPAKKTFITSMGARSITVYILHGFFVKPFYTRLHWGQSFLQNIVIVLFPLFLIYLFSLPVTERLYNKFIMFFNINVTTLFKAEAH